MALPVKLFTSKLCGKNAYTYTKKLDYKLNTYEERKEKLNKILENDDFFVEYFDKYFKTNLNQEDYLSFDNNICKAIEKMADYLLFSPDIKKDNKKTKYIFYQDYWLNQKINKEKNIEEIADKIINDGNNDSFDSEKYDEVIAFLVDKGRNFRKEAKQKILKKDYKDKDFETIIKYYSEKNKDDIYIEISNYFIEYKKVIDCCVKLLKNKNLNFKQKKKIQQLIKDIKTDEFILKDKIKGTIYFKNCLPESQDIKWFMYNPTDSKQVLSLLKNTKINLTDDLGILGYDLKQLIHQISFNSFELKIINMWKKDKSTFTSIAKELNMESHFIRNTLKSICKRIIKQYKENYEDWLYLNWIKGTYKTCSICKTPKLIKHFHWDSTNNCYKSACKKCIKEKNS